MIWGEKSGVRLGRSATLAARSQGEDQWCAAQEGGHSAVGGVARHPSASAQGRLSRKAHLNVMKNRWLIKNSPWPSGIPRLENRETWHPDSYFADVKCRCGFSGANV